MNYKEEARKHLDDLERHITLKRYEIRNMRRQKEEWLGFLSVCQAFCTAAKNSLGKWNVYTKTCESCHKPFEVDESKAEALRWESWKKLLAGVEVSTFQNSVGCPHCGSRLPIGEKYIKMRRAEKGDKP